MSDSAELDAGDGEGSVRVVGTAHVSADSVEEVRETIDEERPDVVAVELDEGRYRQMQGEVAQDLEPSDLLEGNTVFQFIAYWMLSYVQAQMGERFDIEPGADMQAAIETAGAVGSEVALVDRDIQTTIQRFWARMSFFEKLRMVWELCLVMVGIGDPDDHSSADRDVDPPELLESTVDDPSRASVLRQVRGHGQDAGLRTLAELPGGLRQLLLATGVDDQVGTLGGQLPCHRPPESPARGTDQRHSIVESQVHPQSPSSWK